MKLASHSEDGKRIRQAVQNDVQPVNSEPKKTHDESGKRIRLNETLKLSNGGSLKFVGFDPAEGSGLKHIAISEYEVLKDLAASEWASLKSTADKVNKKKNQTSLLEKYREFLLRYMENGETYHNSLLFYCLIWAADTQDFAWAIALGDTIVKTNQSFELGFKRNAITIACDSIMENQEKVFETDKTLTSAFSTAFEKLKTKQWRVDNVVTLGKFYRMAGRYAEETADFKQAYDYYCEAETINPRAGVKKMIERTKALI